MAAPDQVDASPTQQPQATDATALETSNSEEADVQMPLPGQHPRLDREHGGGVSGSFSSLSVERSLERHQGSSGSGALLGSGHQHHLQVRTVTAEFLAVQLWQCSSVWLV